MGHAKRGTGILNNELNVGGMVWTGLRIELRGNLAAMLSAAQNATRSPETGDLELPIAMVAGARNRCQLAEWWVAA